MRPSTDTTEFDHLGREAGELHDRHRPAVGLQPEELGQHLDHGVAADVGVVEHEAVAQVLAHRLDARDEPRITRRIGAVLELAHALVDQVDEIGEQVGYRRVDREGEAAVAVGLAQTVAVAAAREGELGLGLRDDVGENLDFLIQARPAAEEDVDRLLEVEEPERQFQIVGVEDERFLAEGARVFVVRVDQEDAQIGLGGQDGAQDDGDAARLADARGAEDGEMLVQHLVDLDVGRDRAVLLQIADVDDVGAGGVVDDAQHLAAERHDRVAHRRIIGDAAVEEAAAPVALLDLAEQVHARGQLAVAGAAGAVDLGYDADDGRLGRAQRDELADRDAGIGRLPALRRRKAEGGIRAADRHDLADGLAGNVCWHWGPARGGGPEFPRKDLRNGHKDWLTYDRAPRVSYRLPLVEGTRPAWRGSMAIAWRNARARPLKQVSAMWWLFSP